MTLDLDTDADDQRPPRLDTPRTARAAKAKARDRERVTAFSRRIQRVLGRFRARHLA